MSKSRTWVLGAVALMLVIVVGGWTLGISPVLTQAAAANAQLTTAQAASQSSRAELATLKVQYVGISKLKKKLNALRLSIPETETASVFINELTVLGIASGVNLQNVTIASASLYAAPGSTTTTAAAGTTATPAATATPTATPAATTPATTATTTTSTGLVLIPVTITVTGPLEATRLFVDAVQTGGRLLAVSSVNIATSAGDATTTITGEIFSLQGSSDPSPKAKLVPTPTPTATPTLTPTPTPTATKAAAKTGTSGGSSAAPTTAPTSDPTPDPTATS